MPDFKTETRFWLTLGLTLALCLGAAGILFEQLNRPQLPELINLFCTLRTRAFLRELPKIVADPKPLVFLFGSSEIEGYLDPALMKQAFSEKGVAAESYNIGLRAEHPTFFRAFAVEFAEQMHRLGRRADFAFVHIPRVRMTMRYREFSPDDVNKEFIFSITPLARLGNGYDVPEWSASAIKKLVFPDGFVSPVPSWLDVRGIRNRMDRSAEASGYFRLWKDHKFMEFPAWSMEKHGLYGFNARSVPEDFAFAVQQMGDEKSRSWSVGYFQKCCDLLGAHFDPGFVDDMAEGLRALAQFTDHVIIFDLAEAQDIEAMRLPGADLRIAHMMHVLENRSGAQWRDLTGDMKMDARNFVDFEHPSAQGVALITANMAQAVAEMSAKHP
jgi:hypothetical protein